MKFSEMGGNGMERTRSDAAHNYSCVAKWPDCPCNKCRRDNVVGDLCCDKHGKRCYAKSCRDFVKEGDDEPEEE